MKKLTLLSLLLVLPYLLLAQTIPSYYNDVNLNLTGTALKNELATKIISTHTRNLSYTKIWNASKITDLDPTNSARVLLIYGYNDNDGDSKTDRTRSKNQNGGGITDWNREHTYAKSLGTPNLGTSGPGSDAHHLRPADTRFNSTRGSKKFTTGSGNAGASGNGWYPGNEWKGDVARMMMYMYLRYGNRCLPTNVGIGSSSSTPDAMISLFLDWNAQDPVSNFEKTRNTYHGNSSNTYAQGNRNPFIDNPAFATQIWGGPQAEDLFGGGGGGGNACSGGITSFPYNQGFENTIGDWSQASGDNLNWTVKSGGTPSSGTGPSSATQGSYYIYVEASGSGNGYPNKRAIINSPCYNLSAASSATFSFKYHMYGSSDMGSLALEASTDGGSSWSSIWSKTGNKGNSWLSASVNLAAYLGDSVQLRFNRVTGGTWQADVAIDNVALTTSGGGGGGNDCAAASLTLTIKFDNYPEETGWTIKNASGTTVASKNYSSSNADGSTVVENETLASGNYTFTITDVYGDGICCSFGNGSYKLSSSQGTIVTGASFGSSKSTSFCINSSNKRGKSNDLLSEISIYPNPVNSILTININNKKIDEITIFSALGTPINNISNTNEGTVDVSKLALGTYYIRIISGETITTKKFIKN